MDTFQLSQKSIFRTRKTRRQTSLNSFESLVWLIFFVLFVYVISVRFAFSSVSTRDDVLISNSSTRFIDDPDLQSEIKPKRKFYLSWYYSGQIEAGRDENLSNPKNHSNSLLIKSKRKRRNRKGRDSRHAQGGLNPNSSSNVEPSNIWKLKTGNFPESGPFISAPAFEGFQYGRPDAHWEEDQDLAGLSFRRNGSNVMSPWADEEDIHLQAPVVCWNDPPLSWEVSGLNTSGPRLAFVEETIQITGEGCQRCIVGLPCEFMVKFVFADPRQLEFYRRQDLVVTISGPSVLQAEVIEMAHTKNSVAFSVLYQIWDAGNYIVTVNNDCYPYGTSTRPRELAELEMKVFDLSPSVRNKNPMRSESPCRSGLISRWLIPDFETGGNTAYNTPYACTGDLFPVETVVKELVSKEIKEISFVGGSNHLATFLHIQSLLTGGANFSKNVSRDRDISWNVTQPGTNFTLQMNFYWLENIFKDESYGCGETPYYVNKDLKGYEGRFKISQKSQMIFLEVTSWAFENCEHPETAYMRYLPWFLDNFIWWYSSSDTVAHIFFRTSPPLSLPPPLSGCTGPRNRAVKNANNYARVLSDRHGLTFLDFWSIESPFYFLDCKKIKENDKNDRNKKDPLTSHYSCLSNNGNSVEGDVGEAVARILLHRIAFYEKPIDW